MEDSFLLFLFCFLLPSGKELYRFRTGKTAWRQRRMSWNVVLRVFQRAAEFPPSFLLFRSGEIWTTTLIFFRSLDYFLHFGIAGARPDAGRTAGAARD